ncbi:UNVERIFIED_CONTAM: hypothetical protein FKN15_050617 [Acipenser sinensis]
MATGEARAHIQGLGTKPDPKSEPLDASAQSADASTSNSCRAPRIRHQVWAIRWRRQSREPPLNGHRRGAHSHLAQKKNLIPGLQRTPSLPKHSAKPLDFLPETEW